METTPDQRMLSASSNTAAMSLKRLGAASRQRVPHHVGPLPAKVLDILLGPVNELPGELAQVPVFEFLPMTEDYLRGSFMHTGRRQTQTVWWLALALLTLWAPSLSAEQQTGSLYGTVATTDDQALPGVTVTLSGPGSTAPATGTETTREGIRPIPAGLACRTTSRVAIRRDASHRLPTRPAEIRRARMGRPASLARAPAVGDLGGPVTLPLVHIRRTCASPA